MQEIAKTSTKPNNPDILSGFYARCLKLAADIESHRKDLTKLLCQYETHETINDEIERSLSTLRGFRGEFEPIKKTFQGLNIATFFPINLPLYSFVLFGIAPSAFTSNVSIRPPEMMGKVLNELDEILSLKDRFPIIKVKAVPRRTFLDLYAGESDAIIFTGKYKNAMSIHRRCPQALLIYNGSGINPFVLLDNANINKAAEKAVEMRCFNSGQDCAGTDAFFVPKGLADEFISRLKHELSKIKIGPSADPTVRISRTVRESYLTEVETWMNQERPNIVFGGKIDISKGYVYPTIIRKEASSHKGEFHEFFAPVFYILEYDNNKELESLLLSSVFTERTMYISVFGDSPKLEKKLTYAKILKGQIVNDVEQGNHEYGGWGPKANFLLYGDKKVVRPILISRDLHEMLQP